MSKPKRNKKRAVAVDGAWIPVPLQFIRSMACAELSPHGAKLLLDVLSMLGPNATGNGDISLSPKRMEVRGWTSRATLGAAVRELIDNKLLVATRQGGRLDCSLFALSIYPMDCDLKKLDVGPGCYGMRDYLAAGGAPNPSEARPARWRKTRQKLESLDPLRNKVPEVCTAAEQSP